MKKLTNKQYKYIASLRKQRQYWKDCDRDQNLTIIQASYLIKKLIKLNQ